MEHLPAVFGTLIPIAGIAWLALVIWLGVRQKEKEDFHRSEVLKKIAETPGDAAQKVLELMRQQDYQAQVRRREGMKLGGLITLAAGLGLGIFLFFIERDEPVWVVGLIPVLIGAALLGYAVFMSQKAELKENSKF